MKQLLSQPWVSGSQMTSPCPNSLPLSAPAVDTMDLLMALLCLLPLCPGRSRGGGCQDSVGQAGTTQVEFPRVKGTVFCFPFLIRAFLLFSISVFCPHAHRLGCSHSLMPSEREYFRRWHFHAQPWLGPWEYPHLLLPPGLLPFPGITAVQEQWAVADPEVHPADKGGLQM